jgi:superfamily I DNA/RNA helicase
MIAIISSKKGDPPNRPYRSQIMLNILNGLNDAQKETVTTTNGPVLVVAGPGTGKTLTIVRRIAYLIHQGVPPENILAVTFTNRAAREMQERIASLVGNASRRMFISTFHVLGLKILRDNLGDDFSLCDRDGQVALLKAVVQELRSRDSKQMERISYGKLAGRISQIKNGMEDAADLKEIYERYQKALQDKSALDFDDLILQPAEILSHSGQSKKYGDLFQYIIVDEYQDISPAQYRLLRLLTGNNDNICAVGDSDQAIYAFRGADIKNFLDFEKDFSSTKRITLTANYRSQRTILAASNELIKNNDARLDKHLIAVRDQGHPVRVISVPDEKAEGGAIIREIEHRMGGTSHYQMHYGSPDRDFSSESFRFSDFAVLYRTNAQARVIEEAFMASGIPYQAVGGKHSLQKQATEATLEYMRSLISSKDTYSDRPDTPESILLNAADFFDPSADAVTLMTRHMAKGLEFRVVFITGAEEGLIPYTLREDGIDTEEERRLFYVGMTRAQDELFIINGRNRFLYGNKLAPLPSPFISEIPEEFIQSDVGLF